MIGIDADLEVDRPADLGMAEYCDACRICIKVCPINRHGYEACMDAFRSEGKILR